MRPIKFLFLIALTSVIFNSCKKDTNPLLSDFKTLHNTTPFSKIEDEHYLPAFKKAIEEGKNEVIQIAENNEDANFKNTIEALDNSCELLNKISGIFFNMLSAETNPELQKIAEKVSPMLTAFTNDIYLNDKLFRRVKSIYEQKDKLNLNTEQKSLLTKTYRGFIINGANLTDDKKEKFRKVSEELSILSLKFSKNVLDETNKFKLIITDKKDLAGLPENEIEAAASIAKENKIQGWVINLTAPSYFAFMKYAENRELRKKLFLAYNTKALKGDSLDNKNNIKKIVKLRIEKANLLGFENYAESVLEDRMAENQDNVYKLLNNLKDAYLPIAKKEIEELQAFAKSKGFQDKIEAWDFHFYSNKLKEAKYNINDELLKPYLKLENVTKGVFDLAEKLYDIKFVRNSEIETYNPEVNTYEVYNKNGEFLSVLYTDFHPRASKEGGAWMNNYVEKKAGRRPHITIVMNFTKPTETKPSLLTFRELEIFLHEFGHALHGILTQVTYQSISGTNVYRDFVELPSQIMENWAMEKEFLDNFAVHYKTGEKIPQELIDKLKASSNYLAGYTCVRQLTYGLLDMAWHTLNDPNNIPEIIPFEKKAVADVSVLPNVKKTALSTSFNHIFAGGYASGYYGYKWAEVLDADAFSVFKNNGIFDKKTAKSFKENILEKGDSEHPMTLYKRFRGQEPTIDALLKRDGIK